RTSRRGRREGRGSPSVAPSIPRPVRCAAAVRPLHSRETPWNRVSGWTITRRWEDRLETVRMPLLFRFRARALADAHAPRRGRPSPGEPPSNEVGTGGPRGGDGLYRP